VPNSLGGGEVAKDRKKCYKGLVEIGGGKNNIRKTTDINKKKKKKNRKKKPGRGGTEGEGSPILLAVSSVKVQAKKCCTKGLGGKVRDVHAENRGSFEGQWAGWHSGCAKLAVGVKTE